ncbi:alpha/beta hydrolase [Algoriphagus confluentis]
MEDSSIPAITINGIRLHAEAFGNPEDDLIVCLHGGPGSDFGYLLNAKELATRGYRVVLYDQRGSGLSQRLPKSTYTSKPQEAIQNLFEELQGVINHYRVKEDQKVYLLGHSWGAMLATGFSGKSPSEVDGLILFEPGGLVWTDVKEYVSNSRAFGLWSELLNDVAFLDQFLTGSISQHEILDYKISIVDSGNPITDVEGDDGAISFRYGAVINTALFEVGEKIKPDFSIGIENFQKDVLFLYSEHNQAYPDSWATRISSVYPTISLEKIAGTGHNGMVTNTTVWRQQTLPLILNYLNQQ